jgi:hypothetical protein
MAKGSPSGLYVPDSVVSSFGEDEHIAIVVAFILRELLKISAAFSRGYAREIEFLNVAPDKPFEGLTVGADGTNWNPGGGKGVYTYYSSAWNKLG